MYVSGNGFAMLNLACLDKHVQGFGNWKSHSYLSHEVEAPFIQSQLVKCLRFTALNETICNHDMD